MIASLGLILLCQLAGEVIGRGLALPLPGPVAGMVLLLALLLLRDRVPALATGPLAKPGDAKNGVNDGVEDGVEAVSRVLLANMSLLFVPAGVGVIQKLDLLAAHGIAIVAVLAISVMLTLLVTVAVFALVTRLFGRGRKAP